MSRRLAQGFTAPDASASTSGDAMAVVALGANLGAREQAMEAAVAALRALPLTSSVRVAPTVSSVAVKLDGDDVGSGTHLDPDAPEYLNTVVTMRTRLAPSVLLAALHRIEDAHGRVRLERWGDRTLDADLIVYDRVHSDDPRLILPHPRAAERLFVLEPWLALDPDAVLPGAGAVADLVTALHAQEARP